jgi:hypothetical protein
LAEVPRYLGCALWKQQAFKADERPTDRGVDELETLVEPLGSGLALGLA